MQVHPTVVYDVSLIEKVFEANENLAGQINGLQQMIQTALSLDKSTNSTQRWQPIPVIFVCLALMIPTAMLFRLLESLLVN
mmetsp:Transcript_6354/g.9705  ORF Transcript_6354/g.9705 Transcript_6354/m.9705 type:complete len:81 (-) Transcript_6354:259-501(-)